MTDTRCPHAIQRETCPNRFVPVPPPCGCVQSRSDRIRMWSGRSVVTGRGGYPRPWSAPVEAAAHERPQHAEAVNRRALLAGLARASLVVHRHLEDLRPLREAGVRDLRLAVEPARL